MSENTPTPAAQDENQLIAERRDKLKHLRERQAQGGPVAFPNDFKPAHHAAALHTAHGAKDADTLLAEKHTVRIAGRMVLKRVMGKASFATLQDSTGRMKPPFQRNCLACLDTSCEPETWGSCATAISTSRVDAKN